MTQLVRQRGSLIQPGLSFLARSGGGVAAVAAGASTTRLSGLVNLTQPYRVLQYSALTHLGRGYFSQCLKVGCVINIENWTKWLLGEPVAYFKYGSFLPSELL